MTVAIITGSSGLVGSAAARLFAGRGLDVVGIDNDMRATFFGPAASTAAVGRRLARELPGYCHLEADIRDGRTIDALFADHGRNIAVVIHAAAQPSHDWAARDPATDFAVNATGTLNLLEAARRHCPEAPFIFTSTNKVYGDTPNRLPLVARESRWALAADHPFAIHGIDETMSIDGSLHSVFGASKVAADVLVQEYGRYFALPTVCFRCGCLTGPAHAGAELHGFLAYLGRCAARDEPYTVFGHQGKQVRDNLHADDLARAFWAFFEAPRAGAVYNMGGGPGANCSVIEAIALCEELTGRPMRRTYDERARIGDHVWWVSDLRRFRADYPSWSVSRDIEGILAEIVAAWA